MLNWTGGFHYRLIRLLLYLLFIHFLQVFPGNFERNFVVVHRFLRPFKARYVRIYPKTWRSHIAMRVELFGCRLGKLSLAPTSHFNYVFTDRCFGFRVGIVNLIIGYFEPNPGFH